jgi:hypothetical protein
MSKANYVVTISLLLLVALGAVAKRYNFTLSPTVDPLVIVYHDSSLLLDQTPPRPAGGRYWTLAVRSDGSSMMANSVPDAAGHIAIMRSVEFRDRYVVIDPLTQSVSTYRPYRPVVVATQDCKGARASPIFGHPVEFVREELKNKNIQLETTRERWLAIDLNCLVLRERITTTDGAGKDTQVNREAVSVKVGEPPADYFEVPTNYQERGPAELNSEMEKGFLGQHVFSDQNAVDKLQKVYEENKLR